MTDLVMTDALPRIEVMGAKCFVGTLEEAADAVIARALSGAGGYVVQCNVHVLMTAQDDPDLMRALEEAWCVMPDGAPVAWLMRRLGAVGARRVGGPDLMPLVIDRGRAHGLRHAFVGSTHDVLVSLAHRMESSYPGTEIALSVSPPFTDPGEWSSELMARVAEAHPNIAWVALGAPKQELWLRRQAADFHNTVAIGVGAAFDFHASAKGRAPAWMHQVGLEWAHRLYSEPRRLARRYATTNTRFVLASGRAVARRQRSAGRLAAE